jgi:precorrin-2 dehydrogenase / sirohydrochlorin ferrochelatase
MSDQPLSATSGRNNLFPVFLKLEELETLIVGGGNVGLEKLTAILNSCPLAGITLVAASIRTEIRALASSNKKIKLVERNFRVRDLQNKDFVILATDDADLHRRIRTLARKRRLLLNVADTPQLCDAYLGAVVTKGNIRLGISTNGKSPTIAKRLRELFDQVFPEDTETLLANMQMIRDQIKGDFKKKVDVLNEITSSWLTKNDGSDKR